MSDLTLAAASYATISRTHFRRGRWRLATVESQLSTKSQTDAARLVFEFKRVSDVCGLYSHGERKLFPLFYNSRNGHSGFLFVLYSCTLCTLSDTLTHYSQLRGERKFEFFSKWSKQHIKLHQCSLMSFTRLSSSMQSTTAFKGDRERDTLFNRVRNYRARLSTIKFKSYPRTLIVL